MARRLFSEGTELESAGRWSEAAERFRKALAIKETPGLRFHLARCQEEQGLLVEALVEYDRAQELLSRGSQAADVERLLGPARERVQSRVAVLTVTLPQDVKDPVVAIDGQAVSSTVVGMPLPLNPGRHRLSVTAPARVAYEEELQLGPGESRALEVALPPLPAPGARAAATPGASESSGAPARTIVLASEASLFAVGLGAGIAFTIMRGAASDRYDEALEEVLDNAGGQDPNHQACGTDPVEGCTRLGEAKRDRDRNTLWATVGFAGAAASAVAFGATLWLWPSEPSKDADGLRLRLMPAVAGRGLSVRGVF